MKTSYKTAVIALSVIAVAIVAIFCAGMISAIEHNKSVSGDAESYINVSYEPLSENAESGGSSEIEEEPTTTTATTTTTTTTTTTVTTTKTTTAPVSQGRVDNSGTVVINANWANVRSDAGSEYKFLGKANKGEKYTVTGQKTSSTGIIWFEVDYNGKKGYICSSFADFNGKIVGGKAYLTFDDGPSSNTYKILDILDKYNVKATFFVIYHKNCEKAYKAIVERGHTIALHSYTHDYETIYSSEEGYFKDLDKIGNYVEKVTGVRPKITRFPGGSGNTISRKYSQGIMTRLTQAVESKGYTYFDWDIISGDADAVTVKKDYIVSNVKSLAGNKQSIIILMHDGAKKTTTVDALPEVIEFLRAKGYELYAINEKTPAVHSKVEN